MDQKERLALADTLAGEYTRLLDFTRTATVLLGLLPLIYGGLTWLFGVRLWAGNEVHETALAAGEVPVLYGIDSVHGANYIRGATIFPQQINAAASFNRGLVREMGR